MQMLIIIITVMYFLQKIVENLCSQHMPKKKEKKESYSWFSWRRKATEGTTPTSAVPRVMSESDVAASKSVSSHVYLFFLPVNSRV